MTPMTCGRCGRAGQTTRFCTGCGAPLGAVAPSYAQQRPAPYPNRPAPAGPAPGGGRPPRKGGGLPVVMAILLVLLLAAGVTGGWLLLRDDPDDAIVTGQREAGGEDPGGEDPGDEGVGEDEGGSSDDGDTEATDEAAGVDEEDPLGLGTEMVNQPCSGQYLVMLASTGAPADYVSTLRPALDSAVDGGYLVTNGSCESFNQEVDGNPIYAAYEGPFDDLESACESRLLSAYRGAYVRLLDAERLTRSVCSCVVSGRPTVSRSLGEVASVPASYAIADAQALLHSAGLNPDRLVDGVFGAQTERWVRRFQREQGLAVTGVVDDDTWSALTSSCED